MVLQISWGEVLCHEDIRSAFDFCTGAGRAPCNGANSCERAIDRQSHLGKAASGSLCADTGSDVFSQETIRLLHGRTVQTKRPLSDCRHNGHGRPGLSLINSEEERYHHNGSAFHLLVAARDTPCDASKAKGHQLCSEDEIGRAAKPKLGDVEAVKVGLQTTFGIIKQRLAGPGCRL
jgi:hypothetical protein